MKIPSAIHVHKYANIIRGTYLHTYYYRSIINDGGRIEFLGNHNAMVVVNEYFQIIARYT